MSEAWSRVQATSRSRSSAGQAGPRSASAMAAATDSARVVVDRPAQAVRLRTSRSRPPRPASMAGVPQAVAAYTFVGLAKS